MNNRMGDILKHREGFNMKAFKRFARYTTTYNYNPDEKCICEDKQVFHFVDPKEVPNNKENLLYQMSTYERRSNSPKIINYNKIKYDSDELYNYFIIVNNDGTVLKSLREDIVNENTTGIYPNYNACTRDLISLTIKLYDGDKISYQIIIPVPNKSNDKKYDIKITKYSYDEQNHILIDSFSYSTDIKGLFDIMNNNLYDVNKFTKSKLYHTIETYDDKNRIINLSKYKVYGNQKRLVKEISTEYHDDIKIETYNRYSVGNSIADYNEKEKRLLQTMESKYDIKSNCLLERTHYNFSCYDFQTNAKIIRKSITKYSSNFPISEEYYEGDFDNKLSLKLISSSTPDIIYYED